MVPQEYPVFVLAKIDFSSVLVFPSIESLIRNYILMQMLYSNSMPIITMNTCLDVSDFYLGIVNFSGNFASS